MHTLTPLKNKLKRELARARNDINDVLDIIENDKVSDQYVNEVAEDLTKLFEKVERLKQATSRSVHRGREVSESFPMVAEGLSDAIMQFDHLELLRRLEYVQLAEFMMIIHPDLLQATIDELATIEGGRDRIELIYKVLGEKIGHYSDQTP